jgi:hypothetical protein
VPNFRRWCATSTASAVAADTTTSRMFELAPYT